MAEPIVQLALNFAIGMRQIMLRYYPVLLSQAHEDAAAALDMEIAFDLESREVREVLNFLAERVTNLTSETLRNEIRDIIGQRAREGWDDAQTAAVLRERATDWSENRAVLVARTEAAAAYSRGSLLAYERSGVVGGVEWLTTAPCEQCAPLDGKVVPLGSEFAPGISHPPAHPACRCALSPVLS